MTKLGLSQEYNHGLTSENQSIYTTILTKEEKKNLIFSNNTHKIFDIIHLIRS